MVNVHTIHSSSQIAGPKITYEKPDKWNVNLDGTAYNDARDTQDIIIIC